MRVSLEWLRQWVDVPIGADRLAEALTTSGFEVEEVAPAGPSLDGVVVAQVADVEPHPRADKLRVCAVDDGHAMHSIVCGAPNVARGLKVAYATPGTRLPSGQAIEAAEIRGVLSSGMLCSAKELGLADDASGLLVLDDDAPVGTALAEYLGLDDAVLDVNVTANRGDCFSVLGIAREVAAIHGAAAPAKAIPEVEAATDATQLVRLAAPAACPRFAGRVVRNVRTGLRSPIWLRERLRRAGVRAIHPVVDVTNYVMIELGQPLHAYDLAKLRGAIEVRFAETDEPLTLLDGRDVQLEPDVLVIADARGAIGLAGIMGGASTAVDADSTAIFFESAFFAPQAIAGRGRRFGLHTEASLRFERGVDPEQQARAVERATALLLSICGGEAGPLVVTEDGEARSARAPVPLRRRRVHGLLGMALGDEEIEGTLGRLGMRIERREDGWQVVPPAFRFDVAIEEDLIEEVGRIVGYDRIPVTPGVVDEELGTATELHIERDRYVDLLAARGYHETISYGFVDEALDRLITPDGESVPLENPLSAELNVMRRSLWPGLLNAARQNVARQQGRFKLFEAGTEFAADGRWVREKVVVAGLAIGPRAPEHWDGAAPEVDFFDVKGDVEALLALSGRAEEFRFERATHPALAPGQTARVVRGASPCGWLGALHPLLVRELDLRGDPVLFAIDLDALTDARVPRHRPHSKFPSLRRDLAVVVDEDLPVARLLEVVEAAAAERLQNVVVFDVYRGPGVDSSRKSVALGLILQDASRTLTDADADQTVQSVTLRLERELGARIRT